MNLPALSAVSATAAPAASGTPARSADAPGASGFAKLLDHAREGQGVEPGATEARARAPGQRMANTGHGEGEHADAADVSDAAGSPCDAADDAVGDAATIETADNAPADGAPRLHGRSLADHTRKEMPRTRLPTIVDGKGIESTLPGLPATAEAEAKRNPAEFATLLPGWTCTLPLPPPDAASALPADSADGSDGAAPARRGAARAAFSKPDDAAPRTDARDASQRMAAAALPLPAQDAASASPTAAVVEGAPPRAARELEPGLVAAAPAAAARTPISIGSADAAVVTAHVAAHIDTPAFAPALATQLRWLAQERVQQAQITLNPAGMGPLSVQIVIDGANARVDFSADQAATRVAIEASLPVLAAALDEGGLKLSGGGVHDGAAQRHPAWGAPTQAQRAQASHAEPEPGARGFGAGPRAPVARGLVDLVA